MEAEVDLLPEIELTSWRDGRAAERGLVESDKVSGVRLAWAIREQDGLFVRR